MLRVYLLRCRGKGIPPLTFPSPSVYPELMEIWENPEIADQLDQYLANPEDTDTALAMVPTLFGVSDKATYLGFRALGLKPSQALETMGLDEEYLDYWRDTDPAFLNWELTNLRRLQKESASEIIRLGFLKNMALFVAKDATLIRKALLDMDALSKREFSYLLKVRGHYTPGDLFSLEKALNPGAHQDNLTINLSWGSNMESPQEVIEGVQAPYLIEGSGTNEDSDHERISLHDQAEAN